MKISQQVLEHFAVDTRSEFNEAVERSARFINSQKVIPFDKVKPLKLGFRKDRYYIDYNLAYQKYLIKKGYC